MATAVTVYRTSMCPYCHMATRLLDKRGYAYEEVFLDREPDRLRALKDKYDWQTVPMIVVGETFVGGYTDLRALDEAGKLAPLVAGSTP